MSCVTRLQVLRGTTTARLAIVPMAGELVYDTTEKKLYVGDGTTPGGIDPMLGDALLEAVQDTLASILNENFTSDNIALDYDDLTNTFTLNVVPINIPHQSLSGVGVKTHADIDAHIDSTNNPHSTTKAQVGLGNVDNTSDIDKPVSTAQAASIDAARLQAQNFAIQRANHTGTQPASTISDFATAADARIQAQKAQPNGLATLDGNGLVPSSQLPSFVDDVLEFSNLAAFPGVGETGKIYVALDTSRQYRWSGTVYTQLLASPGTTDDIVEGSINRFFTENRVLNTLLTGISFATNAAITGLDSIIVALGKIQAQINSIQALKADKAIQVNAGTGLVGGGDLSANRTISMPNVGTAGTFGVANSTTQVTTDAQGRVTAIGSILISIISSQVTNFADTVRTTLLTGYVVGTSTALAATDTILQAFGKIQAQLNTLFNRNINTGYGLLGGGNLTADRTLAVNLFVEKPANNTPFVTSSTTNVVVGGLTRTPPAGSYLVLVNMNGAFDTNNRLSTTSVAVDGVTDPFTERVADHLNQSRNKVMTTQALVTVNGSQAITSQVRVSGGTLTINNRSMILIRYA